MRNIIIKSDLQFQSKSIDEIVTNICNALIKMDYLVVKEANEVKFKKKSLFNKYSDAQDYRSEALNVIREGRVKIEKDNKGNVVFIWHISLIYLVILIQALSFILTYFVSEIFSSHFFISHLIVSIINMIFGVLIIKMNTNEIVNKILN